MPSNKAFIVYALSIHGVSAGIMRRGLLPSLDLLNDLSPTVVSAQAVSQPLTSALGASPSFQQTASQPTAAPSLTTDNQHPASILIQQSSTLASPVVSSHGVLGGKPGDDSRPSGQSDNTTAAPNTGPRVTSTQVPSAIVPATSIRPTEVPLPGISAAPSVAVSGGGLIAGILGDVNSLANGVQVGVASSHSMQQPTLSQALQPKSSTLQAAPSGATQTSQANGNLAGDTVGGVASLGLAAVNGVESVAAGLLNPEKGPSVTPSTQQAVQQTPTVTAHSATVPASVTPASSPPNPVGDLIGSAGSIVGNVVSDIKSIGGGGVVSQVNSVAGHVLGDNGPNTPLRPTPSSTATSYFSAVTNPSAHPGGPAGGLINGVDSLVDGVVSDINSVAGNVIAAPSQAPGTAKLPQASATGSPSHPPGIIPGLVDGAESLVNGVVADATSIVGNLLPAPTKQAPTNMQNPNGLIPNLVGGAESLVGSVVGDITSIAGHILPSSSPAPSSANSPPMDLIPGVIGGAESLVGSVIGEVTSIAANALPPPSSTPSSANRSPAGLIPGVIGSAESIVGGIVGDATSILGAVVGDATSLVGKVLPPVTQHAAPTSQAPSATTAGVAMIAAVTSNIDSLVDHVLPTGVGIVPSGFSRVGSIMSEAAAAPSIVQESIIPSALSVVHSIISIADLAAPNSLPVSSFARSSMSSSTMLASTNPSTFISTTSTFTSTALSSAPSLRPSEATTSQTSALVSHALPTIVSANLTSVASASPSSPSPTSTTTESPSPKTKPLTATHAQLSSIVSTVVPPLETIQKSSMTFALASSTPTPASTYATSVASSAQAIVAAVNSQTTSHAAESTPSHASYSPSFTDSAQSTLPLMIRPTATTISVPSRIIVDVDSSPTPHATAPFITINYSSSIPSSTVTAAPAPGSPPTEVQKNAAIGVGVALPSAALIAVAAIAYFARRRHASSSSIFGSGSIKVDSDTPGGGSYPPARPARYSGGSNTTGPEMTQSGPGNAWDLGMGPGPMMNERCLSGTPPPSSSNDQARNLIITDRRSNGSVTDIMRKPLPPHIGQKEHFNSASQSSLPLRGPNLSAIGMAKSTDSHHEVNAGLHLQCPGTAYVADNDPPTPFSGVSLSTSEGSQAAQTKHGNNSPSQRDLEAGVPIDIRPHSLHSTRSIPLISRREADFKAAAANPYIVPRLKSLRESRPYSAQISPAAEVTGLWAEDDRVHGYWRDSWEQSAPNTGRAVPMPTSASSEDGDWITAWGGSSESVPPVPPTPKQYQGQQPTLPCVLPPLPTIPSRSIPPPVGLPGNGIMPPLPPVPGHGVGPSIPISSRNIIPPIPKRDPRRSKLESFSDRNGALIGDELQSMRIVVKAQGKYNYPLTDIDDASVYAGSSLPSRSDTRGTHQSRAQGRDRSQTQTTHDSSRTRSQSRHRTRSPSRGRPSASLSRSNTLRSKYSTHTRRYSDESFAGPLAGAGMGAGRYTTRAQMSVDQLVGKLRSEPGSKGFFRRETFFDQDD